MIVIPMAGTSRRFATAGYRLPKYMLPVAGETLFDWSVRSFAGEFAREAFLFVVRDVDDTPSFVATRARALGIARFDVVVLDAPTRGQAETVELGLHESGVRDGDELVIFNIDTVRPGLRILRRTGSDGTLEAFRAPGDHWSFVEPESAGSAWVRRCAEKRRISPLCSTGLYRFARSSDFMCALERERACPSLPELYVAPLFNHLIANGRRIDWYEVPASDVWLAGVPDEYEATRVRLERSRAEAPAPVRPGSP
jgi:hypothetical protein